MSFWIFSYGSLMADGWEKKHGCLCRSVAVLSGFTRAFDKPSIKARGNRKNPAPTLRIVKSKGECHGVAFEFEDRVLDVVMRELIKREGKNFPFREITVKLMDEREVVSSAPIYEGNDLIQYESIIELARMSVKAEGERGNGVQYIRDVAAHLHAAGVFDPVVSDLLAAVEQALCSGCGRKGEIRFGTNSWARGVTTATG